MLSSFGELGPTPAIGVRRRGHSDLGPRCCAQDMEPRPRAQLRHVLRGREV
jgi:hypothetical protein